MEGGGGRDRRRQRPQAKASKQAKQQGASSRGGLGVTWGDCCRVWPLLLALRTGARSPQVTPRLATHRRLCSPESSTPDLSSSVAASTHPTLPASHPPYHPTVLQPHQQPPTFPKAPSRRSRRCLVKVASSRVTCPGCTGCTLVSRLANVNGTGEILAAWCLIHMTRQDTTRHSTRITDSSLSSPLALGCWLLAVGCWALGWAG